jgi:hypothetical protein
MVLYPLTDKLGVRWGSHLREFPAARPIVTMTAGLPPDSSAVKPVIEPAQDGTWVLKMRSVQATASGVPRQRAFYATAGRRASLGVHTASVRDFERSVEEDEARLHREVRMFDLHARQAVDLGQRRLRRAERPAAPSMIGGWSEGIISVDGTPTPIRSARIGDRGWIGWWTSGDYIIEVQSNAVPASQISMTHHRS